VDYPADDVLIARGRYSTLGKERRAQLERVQRICSSVVTEAHKVLKDCEQIPPSDESHLQTLADYVDELKPLRAYILALCASMQTEKEMAWPD